MRTRMFWAGVVGLLSLLPATGCRSGAGRCACCENHAAQAPAAGGAGGGEQVPAQPPFGGQKTCPVSGASLSGVASPVPVAVKGRTVYVCCQQCAAKLIANPDAYRTKAGGAPAARPYGGQKRCPVTGDDLDPAGGATPVEVRGQTVYVCCQGCAAKVKANPGAYLAKVAAERATGTR